MTEHLLVMQAMPTLLDDVIGIASAQLLSTPDASDL